LQGNSTDPKPDGILCDTSQNATVKVLKSLHTWQLDVCLVFV